VIRWTREPAPALLPVADGGSAPAAWWTLHGAVLSGIDRYVRDKLAPGTCVGVGEPLEKRAVRS